MKLNYKTILCAVAAWLAIPSCTDDLKLEPSSAITSGSFWKTENDAQAGATAMYVPLRTQYTNQSLQYNTFFLGEARSEVMTGGTAGASGFDLYYQNRLTPSAAGPSWTGYYSIVNAANLVLKYLPAISFGNQAVKNRLLAEAYTMRAYTYFIMVRTWGDLIIRTEPLEQYDPIEIQKSRSPKAEVFKFIKDDLEKAIQLFPDNTYPAGRFRWSKPAANAVKAEVNLWTGRLLNGGATDFNTALTAISEVQASDVALLANFSDVFAYGNKGNKEVIMVIKLDVTEIPPGATTYAQGYTGYMYTNFTLSTCMSQADRDLIGIQGSNANHAWQLSEDVRNAFNNDDQRKRATFLDIYNYNTTCGQTTYRVTSTLKYKGTVVAGVRQFVDDIILYRYADLLLMKAEAKNELGLDPTIEMNLVRQRAYGAKFSTYAFVNGTKAQNDAAILKERLLELVVEGKRWWDLVRFDKAFDLVPSLQGKASQRHLLLFPISTTILGLEPNVQQNPGYQF